MNGKTLLFTAAEKGHHEVCEFLTKRGAAVHATRVPDNRRPTVCPLGGSSLLFRNGQLLSCNGRTGIEIEHRCAIVSLLGLHIDLVTRSPVETTSNLGFRPNIRQHSQPVGKKHSKQRQTVLCGPVILHAISSNIYIVVVVITKKHV